MISRKFCWSVTSLERMPSRQKSRSIRNDRLTGRRNGTRKNAVKKRKRGSPASGARGDVDRPTRTCRHPVTAIATVTLGHLHLGVQAHHASHPSGKKNVVVRRAPTSRSVSRSMQSATSRAKSPATGYVLSPPPPPKVPARIVVATTGGSIETSLAARVDRSDFVVCRRRPRIKRGHGRRSAHG